MAKKPLQFTLNGSSKGVFVNDGENLLDTLRRGIGDLSPKFGCGQGTCGACSVLIDGQVRLSCLTLSETIDGQSVETTGGLPADGSHPLQDAFMTHFAAQCGYCTPGMLMAAKALLDHNPNPTRDEVIEAISGNICRCTGYAPIIDAILEAARHLGGATGNRHYG
jgi:carbon-monoxide dehydrogenase small subunit